MLKIIEHIKTIVGISINNKYIAKPVPTINNSGI